MEGNLAILAREILIGFPGKSTFFPAVNEQFAYIQCIQKYEYAAYSTSNKHPTVLRTVVCDA